MKMTPDSLRFRFLASNFVLIIICAVTAALLISGVFRWQLERGYHDEMAVHMEELAALVALRPDGQPFLIRRLSDPRFIPLRSGMYWQVERPGYRTLTSPSLGSARLDNDLARGNEMRFGWVEGPMGTTLEYGRTAPAADGRLPLKLMMASDKRLVDKTMAEFDRSLDLALAGLAVLFLAGNLVQLKYVLRPLRRLASDIGAVRTGRTQRMPEDYPDEIKPLVSDLNQLLEAQAELIARSRFLAGKLAHGLRTPLAVILDEAEQLREQGHEGSATIMMREIGRMTDRLDYHLALARSAGHGAARARGDRASLDATIQPILIAMRRLHRQRGIEFDSTPAPDCEIACDPVDLTEILSNLLDNAGKWATSRCVVSWTLTDEAVHIRIDDDGKGIPPELREQAFTIGKRFDDSQPGSGLGLAIARDLARYYGGDVTLDTSPYGGLRAIVTVGTAE